MEEEKKLISYSVSLITTFLDAGLSLLGDGLLREGSTTMVYSYGVTAGEMGLLRNGELVKGDQLVFVPGCFHHLVLRSRKHMTVTSSQWKHSRHITESPLLKLPLLTLVTVYNIPLPIKQSLARPLRDGVSHVDLPPERQRGNS